MTAQDRFARRKTLDLKRASESSRQKDAELIEQPTQDLLASAIDQILEARARDRVTERLQESKMVLLRTVAVPFGVGHLVAAYDRVGGDVHTVNNVRDGVYASGKREQDYANRGDYKAVKKACRETENYKAVRADATQRRESGQFEDSYTGRPGDYEVDVDHTVSAHELFHDPGRHLAGTDTAALSTLSENLNPTSASINRSKKEKSVDDFLDRLERGKDERKARIAALEAKAEASGLTEGERKELASRKALDGVDPEKMRQKDTEAREKIDEEINWDWYTSAGFAGEVVLSAATSTAKTGVMAAFGEFLVEFLAACYDEVRDWYLGGMREASAFDDLKARLGRIASRVLARKEAAWEAFKAGALAGFISSLISVIVNAFKTTQKRMQRMLREGIQSLVRVVTLVARPPEGMSARESLYAATHVVLGTGLMLGGIALEEVLEDLIKTKLPALAFVAEPVAIVLSGVVTGLAVVLTAAMLDRWDPFGVVEEQDLRNTVATLRAEAEAVWGPGPEALPVPTGAT